MKEERRLPLRFLSSYLLGPAVKATSKARHGCSSHLGFVKLWATYEGGVHPTVLTGDWLERASQAI